MLEIGNFKIDPPWRVLNYLYWRVGGGGRKGCFRSTREVKLIKRITANEKKPEFLFNLNPRWEKKQEGEEKNAASRLFRPLIPHDIFFCLLYSSRRQKHFLFLEIVYLNTYRRKLNFKIARGGRETGGEKGRELQSDRTFRQPFYWETKRTGWRKVGCRSSCHSWRRSMRAAPPVYYCLFSSWGKDWCWFWPSGTILWLNPKLRYYYLQVDRNFAHGRRGLSSGSHCVVFLLVVSSL